MEKKFIVNELRRAICYIYAESVNTDNFDKDNS
jgi:hypothetical protein